MKPQRRSWLAAGLLSLAMAGAASAQTQPSPLVTPLPANPPAAPAPPATGAPEQPPSILSTGAAAGPTGRVFCDQNVTVQPVDPRSIPERYRSFVGIFSDAAWNPQLCAALIVETVADDGTATITYAFGPMGSGSKTAGGVLHGTGVIKDGALLFQNSDGSQYVFQPFYSDLAGRWTPPKGQAYEAIFKRSF